MSSFSSASLNQNEIDNFEAMSEEWWQPNGAFKALHLLNRPRLQFIRQQISQFYPLHPDPLKPYTDLKIIDIGCGGGILSEPLARCGATVTGIDAGEKTLEVARLHADQQNLSIDYRLSTAEECEARGEQYDVVIALEVVEHVADVQSFICALSHLVKPDGLVILSTLNRTLKSWGLAIVGAEYILRMIPKGTHNWHQFLTPAELSQHCRQSGLNVQNIQGLAFNPLLSEFNLSQDLGVNYLLCAWK